MTFADLISNTTLRYLKPNDAPQDYCATQEWGISSDKPQTFTDSEINRTYNKGSSNGLMNFRGVIPPQAPSSFETSTVSSSSSSMISVSRAENTKLLGLRSTEVAAVEAMTVAFERTSCPGDDMRKFGEGCVTGVVDAVSFCPKFSDMITIIV